MNVKRKLVYVDQLVRPTSLDIVNALTNHYEVHLHCGGIIKTYAELHPAIKIYWIIPYGKKSFFWRFLSWMVFYFATLPFIFFKRKKKVLFLVSNPPLNFFWGFMLGKIFRIPYNLLIWDIYPDIIVQSGYASKGSYIVKQWASWNTKTFNKGHRIFTVSENFSTEIKTYNNGDLPGVRVIPNWVNDDEIKPMDRDRNQFLLKYGLEKLFTVMYSGNMGKTHDIETIVKTASLLKVFRDIQFLFIGDGEQKTKIAKMVEGEGLTNVLLLPFQDPEMFKSSIAS